MSSGAPDSRRSLIHLPSRFSEAALSGHKVSLDVHPAAAPSYNPPHIHTDNLPGLNKIDTGCDPRGLPSQGGPVIRKADNERQLSGSEVLLMPDALVASQKQIEPCFFGGIQQSAISQTLPAKLVCANHLMAPQEPCKRSRRVGIE